RRAYPRPADYGGKSLSRPAGQGAGLGPLSLRERAGVRVSKPSLRTVGPLTLTLWRDCVGTGRSPSQAERGQKGPAKRVDAMASHSPRHARTRAGSYSVERPADGDHHHASG